MVEAGFARDRSTVSVILPFRDAAATLTRAVESVRAQTFPDWELILVDDGSVDGGGEAARRLADGDARIRLVSTPPNGIVAALNRAVEEASGDVLARMDADDVCHPDRLQKQAGFLARNPGVDLVSCRVTYGGDREAQAGYAAHVDWINGLLSHEDMKLNRFVDAPVAHPSVMFRRSAAERFGGYRDGGFPEDFEMWLRWFEGGARFAKVPENLLVWNDPPGRLSRTHSRYAPEAFYRVKCGYLKRTVPPGRPLWLWGAGRPTRKRFGTLSFDGFIDIDPAKTGRPLHGKPVVMPEEVPKRVFVVLGVATPGAREKAMAFFEQTGRRIGVDYLPAA